MEEAAKKSKAEHALRVQEAMKRMDGAMVAVQPATRALTRMTRTEVQKLHWDQPRFREEDSDEEKEVDDIKEDDRSSDDGSGDEDDKEAIVADEDVRKNLKDKEARLDDRAAYDLAEEVVHSGELHESELILDPITGERKVPEHHFMYGVWNVRQLAVRDVKPAQKSFQGKMGNDFRVLKDTEGGKCGMAMLFTVTSKGVKLSLPCELGKALCPEKDEGPGMVIDDFWVELWFEPADKIKAKQMFNAMIDESGGLHAMKKVGITVAWNGDGEHGPTIQICMPSEFGFCGIYDQLHFKKVLMLGIVDEERLDKMDDVWKSELPAEMLENPWPVPAGMCGRWLLEDNSPEFIKNNRISPTGKKEKKTVRQQEKDAPWVVDDAYDSDDESSEDDEDDEMEEKAKAALTALKEAGIPVTPKLLRAMLDMEEEEDL